jgi:glycosyltransferase involved in cell wall biosynthesis
VLTSFVVPAHNEELLLAATLSSIHESARALGLAYELIVVDDASTDRTAEIARAHDAQVCPVSLRQISAVRNAGARQSRGDWIVFVDADTVVTPAVVDAARRAIADGAVGGGSHVQWDGVLPLWDRALAGTTFWTMRVATLAAGCFVFCTRRAFDAVGGFDETVYATEELWFSRALKREGRFVLVAAAVTTSSRKLRMYSAFDVLRMSTPLLYRGLGVFRDRKHLGLWYDGRRSDDDTSARDR